MNSSPLVSVVIPCYNHGKYVDEAVDSVLNQTYQNIEIIVVNDGSTEEFTNDILKNYSKPKTKVINTSNQGLPSARNNGIKEAKGEFIMPLDADDKIHPEYIKRAMDLIQKDVNIGIVYGKTEFIGDESGVWELPEFNLKEELLHNVIVTTSLFRRADWEKVGGYNKNMIYGFEDHDFWLSILELGRSVEHIKEIMFYYRKVHTDKSRPHSIADITGSSEKILHTFKVLVSNHKKLYEENVDFLVQKLKNYEIEKDTLALKLLHKENAIKDLHNKIYQLENSRSSSKIKKFLKIK